MWHLLKAAYEDETLGAAEKAVLGYLVLHANRWGSLRQERQAIARACGISQPTLRSALAHLEHRGWVEVYRDSVRLRRLVDSGRMKKDDSALKKDDSALKKSEGQHRLQLAETEARILVELVRQREAELTALLASEAADRFSSARRQEILGAIDQLVDLADKLEGFLAAYRPRPP